MARKTKLASVDRLVRTAAVSDGGTVNCVIYTGVDMRDSGQSVDGGWDSETGVRILLETAREAVLAHNTEGRIVFVNAAAEAMFGYSRVEMVGHPLAMLIPERFFLEPTQRTMAAGLNMIGLRKDGCEFPVEIGFSCFETKTGRLGITFISDITERKKSEAVLLQYQKELQSLTSRLLSIQETGNRAIARELHDDLSQKLASLAMEVSTLLKPSDNPSDSLTGRVRALSAGINGLAQEVHAVARRLHPAILDELGLEAALREECLVFSAQYGVPAQFESERVPASIPKDTALCLYRVSQESLRNVAKHAGARDVHIMLAGGKGVLTLCIKDTGGGICLSEAKRKGGLGLISMEERVRLVGGNLVIKSRPGEGTTVEVFVPLKTK